MKRPPRHDDDCAAPLDDRHLDEGPHRCPPRVREPARVVMLAGDLVCDHVDPKKCTACRHFQHQFDLGGES